MQITISTWVSHDQSKKVTESSYKMTKKHYTIHVLNERPKNVTDREAIRYVKDNGLTFEDRVTIEIPITL